MPPWNTERSSIASPSSASRACRFLRSASAFASTAAVCSAVSSGSLCGIGWYDASRRSRFRCSSSFDSIGAFREKTEPPRASAHLSASPTMPSCRAICGPPPSLCPASPPVLGSIAKPYALNVWYCSSNAKSDDGWYCAAAPRKCCFDLIPAERCCPCVRLGPCSGAHIVSYSGLA